MQKTDNNYPKEFQILFSKLEEQNKNNPELKVFCSLTNQSLPGIIEKIKEIVEICNTHETYVTFTRS